MKVKVRYENFDGAWFASSDDIAGWSAGAETLAELKQLVFEGVEYCLESKDFIIEELFDQSASDLVD